MEMIKSTLFWLSYSDKNNHLERIPVAGKSIKYLSCMASELLESDKLHLFLLSNSARTNNNEYLERPT